MAAGPERRLLAAVVLAAALVPATVLLGSVATAAPVHVEGRVVDWSPDASYAVWLVTDLDLTAESQPAAVAVVAPQTGAFSTDWDPGGAPWWVFLHERYTPVGGPPVDHFMPLSLVPFAPDAAPPPLELYSVDPAVLMNREQLSFAPTVLGRLGLLALLLFGTGFGVRFGLRRHGAPPGGPSAPLRERGPAPRVEARERAALAAILVVAVSLRGWGMFSDSLELLEVSYLPGIGRPSPFGGGATGFAAVGGMLWELSRLYCLDLVHPPLWHALSGVMGLFGRAAWFLRLPGLVASLATLWVLWSVLRRRSVATGLAAAAVFAIAAPAVYFGQDATPYAFVGLVAVASIALAQRALEHGTDAAWMRFFAVLIVGFLAHYNVAFVGLAALGGVVAATIAGRGDPRWPAALRRATGPALKLAIVPLGWTWLHLSTFPTVAQDTRLVADTYATDPGAWSFLTDFAAVTAGVRADGPVWALPAALALLALGVHRAARPLAAEGAPPPRASRKEGLPPAAPPVPPLGWLAAAMSIVFVVSVFFFYDNVRSHLGGRVFYGFRWVSWYHPVLLGVGALGLVRGAGPRLLRGALGAIWAFGVLSGTWVQVSEPRRPDYREAARVILDELEDGDAVASLPTWFQRGILGHYLFQTTRPTRSPDAGEAVWVLDGKRVTVEAVHPSLPFESTAKNPHYDRLWVAVIEETMFGRDKFSAEVARGAVAWADRTLVRVDERTLDGIRLLLYRVPHDDLALAPGEVAMFRAARVISNSRTYPRLGPIRAFERPVAPVPGDVIDRTTRYQAPMTPGCVDWEYASLGPGLDPDAPTHWILDLRVPIAPGSPAPGVRRSGLADLQADAKGGAMRVQAVGGPCTGPGLALEVIDPR